MGDAFGNADEKPQGDEEHAGCTTRDSVQNVKEKSSNVMDNHDRSLDEVGPREVPSWQKCGSVVQRRPATALSPEST